MCVATANGARLTPRSHALTLPQATDSVFQTQGALQLNASYATLVGGVTSAGNGLGKYPAWGNSFKSGLPTFMAVEANEYTVSAGWYDVCGGWSGAEITRAGTSFGMTLHGDTSTMTLDPGANGTLQVRRDLLRVDVAARAVSTAGDLLVEARSAAGELASASRLRVRAGLHRASLEADVSNGSASHAGLRLAHGSGSFNLRLTNTTLSLSTSVRGGGLVLETPAGMTLRGADHAVHGRSAFHGSLTSRGPLEVQGDTRLGRGAQDTLAVNAYSQFLRSVTVGLEPPSSAPMAGVSNRTNGTNGTALNATGVGGTNGTNGTNASVAAGSATNSSSTWTTLWEAAKAKSATLNRSLFSVLGASFLRDGLVSTGDAVLHSKAHCKALLQADADVVLGTGAQDTLTVRAAADLRSTLRVAGESSLGVTQVRGAATFAQAVGFLSNASVMGAMAALGDVSLGVSAADSLEIRAQTRAHSNVSLLADTTIGASVNTTLEVVATAHLRAKVSAHGDVELGDSAADTVLMRGTLASTGGAAFSAGLTTTKLGVSGMSTFSQGVTVGKSLALTGSACVFPPPCGCFIGCQQREDLGSLPSACSHAHRSSDACPFCAATRSAVHSKRALPSSERILGLTLCLRWGWQILP